MYRGYAASTFQRVVQQADGNVCIASDADSAAIRTYWQLCIFCLIEALRSCTLPASFRFAAVADQPEAYLWLRGGGVEVKEEGKVRRRSAASTI